MSAHTEWKARPATWPAARLGTNHVYEVVTKRGGHVVGYFGDERRATRAAAAPTLLAACKDALCLLEIQGIADSEVGDRLRAAIAAATPDRGAAANSAAGAKES